MAARSIGARLARAAILTVVLCLSAGVLARPALAARAAATDIVQLRPDVPLASGAHIVRAAGGRTVGTLRIIHGLAVRAGAAARVRLADDARVRAVTRNAAVHPQDEGLVPVSATPPPVTGPPPIDSSSLSTAYPFSVRAPAAWASAMTGAGVTVAVVDTGIDGALPDFAAPDGTSRVIASAVTNPDATSARDTYGHGTHVAGIIAGNGNARPADDPTAGEYIGIAPDANLVSVKVGDDDGNATVLDVIYGLQFVVDHKDDYGIRVVNLSLESTTPQSYLTDPLDAAVESAYFSGIVVVAAAGNRGTDPDAADYAPGNDPFVLSVGALDDQDTAHRSDDVFTDWSSRGQSQDGFTKPEIGAPGAHIVSTLAPDSAFTTLCPSCIVDGSYIRAGGTSMAAPVVSGVAALLLQEHKDWTPDEVKSTLIETGRDVPGGIDEVNAAAALAAEAPSSGANAGIPPNELGDGATGAIDYTRSSWSRSSWSRAPEDLVADWTRSSWSCVCTGDDGDSADPTRSSWSRSSWSRSSWSTRWGY
jgi:serine protease AprX